MVSNVPTWAQSANIGTGVLTVGKVAPLTTSTNTVLVFSPGPNGSIITGIGAIPTNTQSNSSQITIYHSPDSGQTVRLIGIGLLGAYTFASNTIPVPLTLSNLNGAALSVTNPFYVPYSGGASKLYASTSQSNGDGIVVTVNGVDL